MMTLKSDISIMKLESAYGKSLLGKISHSRQDFLIADPHTTWWDPTTSFLFRTYLRARAQFWDYVGDGNTSIDSNKVVGDGFSGAVFGGDALPGVGVAPVLERVTPVILCSTATHIHLSVVGEFELDFVC
jgi:hypothetical protein